MPCLDYSCDTVTSSHAGAMASRGSGSGSGKGKGKKASGGTRGKGRMPLDGEITERISTLRMANTPRTERLRRNLASLVLRQALQGVYSVQKLSLLPVTVFSSSDIHMHVPSLLMFLVLGNSRRVYPII